MSDRNLGTTLATGLANGVIVPAFFAMLTFRSATKYVWSGLGSIAGPNGQTYVGVGSLASIGAIVEGIGVQADGTTVGLSGLEKMVGQSPDFLSECLTDIRSQAPATLWFGLLSATGNAFYQIFSGVIDKAAVSLDPETIGINLALESRLVDLGRATARRYTSADQNLDYPDDSGFDYVEPLNDMAIIWGN